jgi:hypothetical protein
MQKALFISACMFTCALAAAASAREPTRPHMPNPGDAAALDVQAAVAHRQQAAGISGGTENPSFDSELWLDKALDRKLWICRGC